MFFGVAKLIESLDNIVRPVELNVYQPNSDWLCTVQRPIQQLVPLKIQTEIPEIEHQDEENQNNPRNEECLQRTARLNADNQQNILHESN